MNELPPAVRLLPMSLREFKNEDCHNVEDLQQKFFLKILPSKEKNGQYRYLTRGLDAPLGTIVLFQCKKQIIASAVFIDSIVKPEEDGYKGSLNFDVNSIMVFQPVGADELKVFWPQFNTFTNAKRKLDPKGYAKFEKHLIGVTSPRMLLSTEEPTSPPERMRVSLNQILRDTKLARQVKHLHNFRCQICDYTIELPDGSCYAESHHIHPLGQPHNGPDVIDNIICVCPNHHAELDYGVSRILLKSLHSAEGHTVNPKYADYHNHNIFKPR